MSKDELIAEVLQFRDRNLEIAFKHDSLHAAKLSYALTHALIGIACGYRSCCILEFVKNTMTEGKFAKPILCKQTGAVLCRNCIEQQNKEVPND